jgi:uncharacterized protein YprB with RNaseH-like and TPR domain
MAASHDKFSRLSALRPARPAASRPTALSQPREDDVFARIVGAGLSKNHFGEHLALRNWYSTPEFTEPSPVALDLLSRHRDESLSRKTRTALEDPEKWLFLDTETTGLAGGTGTYAFLIGIAWWDAGGLQVEQFFMRDFGDEHSVLHELSERLAQRPVLVTFNGKTFDWPLLQSRFTMTRCIDVPQLSAHLDLLHPARALWKLRLGSVRLVELERHVLDLQRLGWHREDDISSAMIPQYYFDYLRGGSPLPLVGVAKHNQMDLRGLAGLYGKVTELLAAEHDADHEIDSLDLFGLSRFLQRRGDSGRAHTACAQALDLGLPAEIRPRARRELAQLAKQRGDHAQAVELWLEIISDPQDGVHACEQLAIYYERREKNPRKALEFAQLALGYVARSRAKRSDFLAAAKFARLERNLLKRIARLRQRISGQPCDALAAHP